MSNDLEVHWLTSKVNKNSLVIDHSKKSFNMHTQILVSECSRETQIGVKHIYYFHQAFVYNFQMMPTKIRAMLLDCKYHINRC